MIEFEMKFPSDHVGIREKLKEMGGEFIVEDTNHDIYYNHPARDFAETDEALRVRQTKDQLSLTYKGPKLHSGSKSREELTEIIQSSNMSIILERLGFIPSGEVRKIREVWKYENIIVTIDDVENLGKYVEMEIEGNPSSGLDKMVAQMTALAEKLGLDPNSHITSSYLELCLKNSANQ